MECRNILQLLQLEWPKPLNTALLGFLFARAYLFTNLRQLNITELGFLVWLFFTHESFIRPFNKCYVKIYFDMSDRNYT